MGGILDSFFGGGGDDAADASIQAANIQAGAQTEALDYLKEVERLPRQFREGALERLGGLYGLEGGVGSQLEFIEEARQSPLYEAILGGREQGEEAIARHASMTGGLRSGDIQTAFYDYNTQLQNQALLQSYNERLGGLQGLSKLPSYALNIAQTTAGIGQTQAQGITAAEQARQEAGQQGIGNLLAAGKIGAIAGLYSDIRLKENIHYKGEKNGHSWFSWDWNDKAKEIGLTGASEGVMAHLVYEYMPEAISTYEGFVVVNQDMILQEVA